MVIQKFLAFLLATKLYKEYSFYSLKAGGRTNVMMTIIVRHRPPNTDIVYLFGKMRLCEVEKALVNAYEITYETEGELIGTKRETCLCHDLPEIVIVIKISG